MLVRARIIDLRSSKPSIILQEFIRYSHKIPTNSLQIDYEKNCFGTPNYPATPIAVGHRGLSKEIAKRLEDYILIKKPPSRVAFSSPLQAAACSASQTPSAGAVEQEF